MSGNIDKHYALSHIQHVVLERFSAGQTHQEISQELELSELTIGIILESAIDTMGATSLSQAAVMFRRSICRAA